MSPWSSHPAGGIGVHTLDHARYGGHAQMDVAVNRLGADEPNQPTIRLWLHNPDLESFDSETEILLTTVQAQCLAALLTDYVDDLQHDNWQSPQSFLVRPMRMPQMEYQGPQLTAETAEQLADWAQTFNVDVRIPPHLRPPLQAPPEYVPMMVAPDIVEEWGDTDTTWVIWAGVALAAVVALVLVIAINLVPTR